jgi:AraC-like DNA-binding protein
MMRVADGVGTRRDTAVPMRGRELRRSTSLARIEAVERAIAMMRTHFAEPISLDRLSEAAVVSRYHLNRIFHDVTGVPPGQFLAAIRIEAAKRLLVDSRLRVVDVCYEVGYGSVGTFTSLFTALVGVQPTRFRALARAYAGLHVRHRASSVSASRPGGLTGTITCDDGFAGMACVGLFSTRIPQGPPAGCATSQVPGRFVIDRCVPARQHVLAMAVPDEHRLLDLMLPDQSRVRVGWTAAGSHSDGEVRVVLRRLGPIDPPVVLAYPAFLGELASGGELAPGSYVSSG